MSEDRWYSDRRTRWKPARVRLLLIGESAPDDGGDEANRRFFFDDRLTGNDGLFRQTIRVLYGNPQLESGPGGKTPWLQRLKDDGVFLIDLATAPVNYHSAGERAAALHVNIETTVGLARRFEPEGIVLVKKNVFEFLAEPLRSAGLPLLHGEFIPFPSSGQQKRFREQFAEAVARVGF